MHMLPPVFRSAARHALRSGARQAPRRLTEREIAVEKAGLCARDPAAFAECDCDIGPLGIPIAPSHHASLLIFFVAIHGLYFFPREKPSTENPMGPGAVDEEGRRRGMTS